MVFQGSKALATIEHTYTLYEEYIPIQQGEWTNGQACRRDGLTGTSVQLAFYSYPLSATGGNISRMF